MPEMLSSFSPGVSAVEWRVARPEDAPIWVALTREGQAPLVPREALAEPDQRPERDRQELREELEHFQNEAPERRDWRFLLWRASRPLGRLCFRFEGEQAYLGGLALLPTVGSEVIKRIAREAIDRATIAGARTITAAYEARHAAAFAATGFREIRRYTPMVAATRRVEESEEEIEPGALNMVYQARPIEQADSTALSLLFENIDLDGGERRERAPIDWLSEMAQWVEASDNGPLPECSFVAEFHRQPLAVRRLAGAILVSRWQGAAVIDELMVLARYRRRGIGSALLRQAMVGLRHCGYASVMLVVKEGGPAQEFCRKFGFREVQPTYVEGERVLYVDSGF